MVRIINQNFSPPRSRHSSGETDRDLAERTKLALSSLGGKRFDRPDYESSSDSFWDSELDGEQFETILSEASFEIPDINGNGSFEKSNVLVQRKDRRRERNKLSAQAYRKRVRSQSNKEQKELLALESENRRLHKLVETLEKKKDEAKKYLRGGSVPMPDGIHIASAEGGDRILGEVHHAGVTAQDQQSPVVPSDETVAKEEFASFNQAQVSSTTQFDKMKPSSKSQINLNLCTNRSLPLNANINRNVSKFNLYPAQLLTSKTWSDPSQKSQVFLQTHALVEAAVCPQDGVQFPACAIPAFVAVPFENPTNSFINANMNCNSFMSKNVDCDESKPSDRTGIPCRSPSLGCLLKNVTPAEPITGSSDAFFGLVKVDMCNSNDANGFDRNLNTDNNGNTNDCDNINKCARQISQSFPTYNLNLNPNAMCNEGGKFSQKSQGSSQQKDFMQYMFVNNDQAMAI